MDMKTLLSSMLIAVFMFTERLIHPEIETKSRYLASCGLLTDSQLTICSSCRPEAARARMSASAAVFGLGLPGRL